MGTPRYPQLTSFSVMVCSWFGILPPCVVHIPINLLPVQLGVLSKHSQAKWLPPLTCQIPFDTILLLDAVKERTRQHGELAFASPHFLRERIKQSTQHMPQSQVRIAQLPSNQKLAFAFGFIRLEHTLEEAQKLGNTILTEIL